MPRKAVPPPVRRPRTPSPIAAPLPDTPVGELDRLPKIQLCLEIRDKKVPGKKKNSRTEQVLEITVLFVKYIPKTSKNQLVKLRFLHQRREDIWTTDLITGTTDARFIEAVHFPIYGEDMEGSSLQVSVCDRKPTRSTKGIGEININLEDLEPGKPICKWYNLKMAET